MNTSQKPYQHQVPPWKTLRQKLLSWYDTHQRKLPWRHTNIADANPYQTWLSEIMLQQTTVDTVIPYFKNFLKRWPAVEDLANATIDQVLHQWQGLGYYRRAHNLHACAGVVAKDFNGVFPKTVKDLKALPGLGDYTAKAVASIALNQAAVPIDGNVERVIARLLAIQEPFPTAKKTVQSSVIHFENDHHPGDFAQALMDLGATVCTPKNPKCMACPWQTHCAAYMQGCTEELPKKLPKKPKPKRFCSAYILRDPKERFLVEKRPDKGLLAGMTMCPTSAWSDDINTVHAAFDQIELHPIAGHIKHVFTHFELYVHVFEGQVKTLNSEGIWLHSSELKDHPLPTLMKKILLHAKINLHNTGNTCET